MATYRIGIGSFNLKDGAVGIGTESTGLGNLKVEGTYKTTDLDVTGVSTFTRYAGFAADNINVSYREDLSLTGEHQTTSDIVVGVNSTFTVSTGATVCTSSVECISLTDNFSPPCGYVDDRPECPVEGTVRFNKDLNMLEFYNGVEWRQFTVSGARGRGFAFGGYEVPVAYSTIRFVEIATQGNAQYFGDLSATTRMGAAFGNTTRGIHGVLYPSNLANLDYITIASGGDAIDWGADRTSAQQMASLASSTRGIFAGGASTNVIDYIEIQTTGNCTDFGDLTTARRNTGGFASPTRGVISAGGEFPFANHKTTDYITVASKGNATGAGDLIGELSGVRTCSSSTRGVFMGGYNPGASIDNITYVTTASLGNAIDFGNLSGIKREGSCVSSQTRGLFMGGITTWPAGVLNTIDYITIASTGNAVDFGDDIVATAQVTSGCSDSHGGLGGY